MKLLILGIGCLVSAQSAATADGVYPGATWQTATPETVRLDPAVLDAFRDAVGGRGCVVRHGLLVASWGDITARGDVASAAKPLYTHLLLKAVEDGRIASVDEPLAALEPRLAGINADLGYKDSRITWRQAASQTSCYGVREEPGTAFDYNDWQMALFIDTLFGKAYGVPWEDVDAKVLRPLLADPIGCEDDPTFLAFGPDDRPGRLAISPRDFARFGLLYLRGGRWGDQQIISENQARKATTSPLPGDFPRTAGEEAEMLDGQRSLGSRTIPDNQCDHLGSYSWLWWTNGIVRGGARHWPDVPVDAYGAFGHGGPRAMVVIPSLDLIVSWNDARIESREAENEALRRLVSAVQDGPLPGQVVMDPRDPRWLMRHEGQSLFLCGPGDPEGFLFRGTRNPDGTRNGDQDELLAKMEGTGANCIYIMAARSHGGDGGPDENPFVDADPDKGVSPGVLDQWAGWLDEMDRIGVVALFFLYDDSTRVWNTGDEVGEPERQFVHALVGRLRDHRNLIWCIAEEYSEALSPARVRALAAEVRAADGGRRPIAVHLHHGLRFDEFADDPNIDMFAIQYNVPTAEELHAGVLEAGRSSGDRYNLNLSEAADWGTGAEARLKSWACAMGGAYVMALGMDIAGTPVDDLRDCGRLVRFMESVDLAGMRPRDELAAADTQYVLAADGGRAIAYSSRARAALGLTHLAAGRYDLRWMDCVTGATAVEVHEVLESGPVTWPLPNGIAGPEVVVAVAPALSPS